MDSHTIYMGSCGITTDFYGFLWIPMDPYLFLRIAMSSYRIAMHDSYVFPWTPVDSSRIPIHYYRIPVVSYGFLRTSMYSYEFLWVPMGFLYMTPWYSDSYRIPMDSYRFRMDP